MKNININDFKWGIEHEFAVINRSGEFCDFTNTTFEDFNELIAVMPTYESDYPGLRVGDLGIKSKRWYIEGFERFSETGEYLRTDIKGFEIRTPICHSLDDAVKTLRADFALWEEKAKPLGFSATSAAFNPFQVEFIPAPPLNPWEVAHRKTPEERSAFIHMLTAGPDISFSHPDLSTEATIDIAKKLTFYSPYIVPFSYSSPFYQGELCGGLSYRTYYRTGRRPAVMVFVDTDEALIKSEPTLTEKARLPSEVGRIEFKAFDAIADLDLYQSLGTLLLGIALDDTLEGRAIVPDRALHQFSAKRGFSEDSIFAQTKVLLAAAKRALPSDYHHSIDYLESILESRRVQADRMVDVFKQTGSILQAIKLPTYV